MANYRWRVVNRTVYLLDEQISLQRRQLYLKSFAKPAELEESLNILSWVKEKDQGGKMADANRSYSGRRSLTQLKYSSPIFERRFHVALA